VTTITALPGTPPTSTDPSSFDTRADAFVSAIPTFITQTNLVAGEVNTNATNAALSASTALSAQAVAQASAAFKGLYTALSGALNIPASTYHLGKFWILSANVNPVTSYVPGTAGQWIELNVLLPRYTYANRNDIRGLSPAVTAQAIIEELGIFCWYSGSTELDDDETCFATGSGRWILETASPDFVLSNTHSLQAQIETKSEETKKSILGNFLFGSGLSGIPTIAATTQSSFFIYVEGAEVGDRVFVNAPNNLTGSTSRLYYHAAVTAYGVVTVYISNPTASLATLVEGTWLATVIKGF
jgi:hypothetical protein